MKIAIITDSCADLTNEECRLFDIDLFPMLIFFGDKKYSDGVTITPEELYIKFGQDDEFPFPSQAPPKEIIDAYQRAKDKGYKEFLVITISSKLSATYESALQLANQFPEIKINVVDSKNVSSAEGFMVLLAAVLNKRGYTLDEINNQVKILRDNIKIYFTVENLENLKRLGRFSGAQYKLAKTFKKNPILGVSREGKLVTISKVKKREDVFFKINQYAVKNLDTSTPKIFSINHGNRQEIAVRMFKDFKRRNPNSKGRIGWVGAAIGSHTGAGVLACTVFEDRWNLSKELPFLK
ncbi:MAG: DegV family protein [Candidatus Heimdallarchaeota archaeon]|nr:DegV family protein [Candidatus Heimdallarchaeota archaeon]